MHLAVRRDYEGLRKKVWRITERTGTEAGRLVKSRTASAGFSSLMEYDVKLVAAPAL